LRTLGIANLRKIKPPVHVLDNQRAPYRKGGLIMAAETKLPVTKKPTEPTLVGETWRPFEALRKEVDRLFDDFGDDFWRRPFPSLAGLERGWTKTFVSAPAADVTETEKAYEITAELPGIDQKNVEVNLANGGITIKGEKKEESEEKKKDYYVSERRYGSFERYFALPDGVDSDKIEATFKNGVLKVTLPKTAEAQKAAKKIEVKAA
jgi:HSP20 family protein